MEDRDLLIKLGANLRAIRRSKGLQQKEVANMVGISAGQYGRIENGTTKASAVSLANIAKVLGVSTDILFFGESIKTGQQEPVVLKDKELVEKMKQLDKLSEKDKELAHQLLDLILAKVRFKDLMNDLG